MVNEHVFDTMDGMKVCCTCHVTKALEEFNLLRRSADGRQPRCRECQRRYHAENREQHVAQIRARQKRIRVELAMYVLGYLSDRCCVDCGEDDPVVLEFDHVGTKTANVSRLVTDCVSETRLAAEIAQCEVVCANCHRRRTSMRASSRRWRATRRVGRPGLEPGTTTA